MSIFTDTKARIGSIISSLASVLGIGGSGTSVICQSTCSASSSVLPFLGVSLATTPFAFIEWYQTPIWWVALSLFVVAFWFYRTKNFHTKFEHGLLLINGGLLVAGVPYFRTPEISPFIIWTGIILSGVGTFHLVTAKKIVIQFTNSHETKQTN